MSHRRARRSRRFSALLLLAAVTAGPKAVAHAQSGGGSQTAERTRAELDARLASPQAPLARATLLNQRGTLAAASGAWREAERDFGESAALAQAVGDLSLTARAQANRARALLNARAADADVRIALASAERAGSALAPSSEAAELWISVGRLHASLAAGEAGGIAAANAAFERAHESAVAAGDGRLASFALGYRGELYAQRGRADDALALTRRALFAAQAADAPDALYRWQWQLARLQRSRGEIDAAIASLRDAARTLGAIRFERAAEVREVGRADSTLPLYGELVDLLLEAAPPASDGAAHQQRLAEVRELLEQAKAVEVRDYFRDECVDELEAKTLQLDQVSKGALVVYPVVLPDRLELLITLRDGLRRIVVPVPRAELTAEIARLRALLEKRTTREFLPHAQRVYDWLVRPYQGELTGPIDTLVIVPDGALRTIPLGALHDGERFLVERIALATTPGLSLTDPRPLTREGLSVFSGGLSAGVQGFPSLGHVPRELESVRELLGGEQLVDGEFRAPRVEGALAERDFEIVHVATHAQFEGDPERSFLLTYDGRITLGELGETVGRTRFRERPIELITLSACETAQGDERAALGLAGVAVQAGARSALGTLWSVNDEAAARLVTEFYAALRSGAVSKAEALRRAQRALLADPNTRHPFYWSAFLLIANWL
jgi:CHAT domain-containing protein